MPKFSKRSLEKLKTCAPELILICNEIIKEIDITILSGHRDQRTQNDLYDEKKTKLLYPHSKHNSYPSKAVDIALYPINWSDLAGFYFLSGYVYSIARANNIKIRHGGDWDMDLKFNDQTFMDLPHYELVE